MFSVDSPAGKIRGPYYSPLGKRALLDIFETMGAYVDVLKFAGGSFALMPESAVARKSDADCSVPTRITCLDSRKGD